MFTRTFVVNTFNEGLPKHLLYYLTQEVQKAKDLFRIQLLEVPTDLLSSVCALYEIPQKDTTLIFGDITAPKIDFLETEFTHYSEIIGLDIIGDYCLVCGYDYYLDDVQFLIPPRATDFVKDMPGKGIKVTLYDSRGTSGDTFVTILSTLFPVNLTEAEAITSLIHKNGYYTVRCNCDSYGKEIIKLALKASGLRHEISEDTDEY